RGTATETFCVRSGVWVPGVHGDLPAACAPRRARCLTGPASVRSSRRLPVVWADATPPVSTRLGLFSCGIYAPSVGLVPSGVVNPSPATGRRLLSGGALSVVRDRQHFDHKKSASGNLQRLLDGGRRVRAHRLTFVVQQVRDDLTADRSNL